MDVDGGALIPAVKLTLPVTIVSTLQSFLMAMADVHLFLYCFVLSVLWR